MFGKPNPVFIVSSLGFALNAPLALLALALNLLFLAVAIHGHRYLSTKFFYIVAKHLLIADFVSITDQILIVLPIMVLPPEESQGFLIIKNL